MLSCACLHLLWLGSDTLPLTELRELQAELRLDEPFHCAETQSPRIPKVLTVFIILKLCVVCRDLLTHSLYFKLVLTVTQQHPFLEL